MRRVTFINAASWAALGALLSAAAGIPAEFLLGDRAADGCLSFAAALAVSCIGALVLSFFFD